MRSRYLVIVILLNFSLITSTIISAQLGKINVIKGQAQKQATIILKDTHKIESRVTSENIPARLMPIPYNLPIDSSLSIISTFSLKPQVPTREISLVSQSPSVSFQALNDSLTTIPPDTQGAVGPNHVMTTLNDRIRIQSKTGVELLTTSLSTFWGLTTDLPFDPRITYDPTFNRWITSVLINPESSSSMILLAVSQTDNPLGAWNRYSIKVDPTATATSGLWADFDTLGFNGQWIVVQTNMFDIATGNFDSSHVYVFNKAQLYANGPGNYRLFNLSGLGATQYPAISYDNTNPNLYLLQNYNGNANGNGYLLLYRLSGAVGSENLSIVGFVSVHATWESFSPFLNGGFAPQSDTPVRIDTNDARILGLVQRNGSLWAAQTVFLPAGSPTHSAIQWWQIDPTIGTLQFGRIEDTSATLNSGYFYAYPSIAVNTLNGVLIGYSYFSPSIHPSSGYSYRAATDLPNTLRGTATLKVGLDIYTKDFGYGDVRWGDYSNTIVDPNGIDFWTIQESSDTRTASGVTRWLAWWGKISPA